jgi:plasmid stabilization system protein ParE
MEIEIIWLRSAANDLERLQEFVMLHNPRAAQDMALKIIAVTTFLKTHPELGKPVNDLTDFRELTIPFGAGGYLLRYRYFRNIIYIVNIRHNRENRFIQ